MVFSELKQNELGIQGNLWDSEDRLQGNTIS